MNEPLKKALDQISDKHLAEAAAYQKQCHFRWAAPIAAMLVLAVLIGVLLPPATP